VLALEASLLRLTMNVPALAPLFQLPLTIATKRRSIYPYYIKLLHLLFLGDTSLRLVSPLIRSLCSLIIHPFKKWLFIRERSPTVRVSNGSNRAEKNKERTSISTIAPATANNSVICISRCSCITPITIICAFATT